MLKQIRAWLAAPIFEMDETKTRQARLLNVVLLMLMATSVLNVIISLVMQNTTPLMLGLIVGFCILTVALRFLMLRGHVLLVSVLVVTALTVITTISLGQGGTIRQITVTYYFLSSVLVALLIGRRTALGSAILHILLIFILAWAETNHLLPEPSYQVNNLYWISFSFVILLVVLLIDMTRHEVDNAIKREQSLNEITRAISSTLDLSTGLEKIVRLAVEQVGAEAAVLGLISPDGRFIEQRVVYNMPQGFGMDQPIPRGMGVGWQVVESGQGVILSEYQNHPAALKSWVDAGISGFIDVPLVAGENNLGVLGLFSFQPEKIFSRRDFELAGSIGRQVGITIQNARLLEIERQRANHQEALSATLADLSRELDMPRLLQVVLERAVRLSGTDLGELAIYDEASHDLVVMACYGLEKDFSGTRLRLGEGTMGKAAQTRQPVLVNDYQDWDERLPQYQQTTFHAALAMPLFFGDHLMGVLALGYGHVSRQFTTTDVQILSPYATQSAIAIQNARLFDAERKRANHQEALRATLADLSSELEMSKLLHVVLQRAVRLSGTDAGELGIYDEAAKTVQVAASYGLDHDFTGRRHTLGEGLMGMSALTRQAVVVPNYPAWESRSRAYARTAIHAALAMPLFYGEHLLGVLALGYFDPQKRFSPDDVQLINPYAVQAAIAIQNAQLFGAAQRQLSELRVLHAAAMAGTQAISEDTLIRQIFSIIRGSLSPDVFDILVLDETTNSLHSHLASRPIPTPASSRPISLSEGVVGKVARTGQPWRIPDVSKVPEYLELTKGMRSELCIPIQIGERLLGIINLESRKLNAFSEADERTLSTLSGQLAIALDRLRAEAELRRLNSDLERRVLERTSALEVANRELESFAYSVSHDLRAPLRAINGFGHMLNDDFQESLGEDGRGLLNKMLQSAARMDELIADLLQFSRLSRQPLNCQPVSITKLVEQFITEAQHSTQGRDIRWQVSDLPDCQADPSLLRQVMFNLLDNAVKYSSGRNPAIIEVGSKQQDGETIYFVRDNGAGFNMKYASKLFGVFQRLHSETQFEGTGIGLATVARIITRHGGRIWAEAEVDKGAMFFFTLPG